MDDRDEAFERVAEAQRTTKAEARRGGIGTPEAGREFPAPSYADHTGVADLGVDEPALPAQPAGGDSGSRPGPDPTGMFAGETVEDRREEEAVRTVLEAEFPETKGHWKVGGRGPSADAGRGLDH